MKLLKKILIGLATFTVLISILLFIGKKVHVDREIQIDSSIAVIKEQMIDFNKFRVWFPWADKDVNCKYEFSDKQGAVGASFSYSGNKEIGSGTMIIEKITSNKVIYKTIITEPMNAESEESFDLVDLENGKTKVVWNFDGEIPLLFVLLGGMDGVLGPEYEKGLKQLKSIINH